MTFLRVLVTVLAAAALAACGDSSSVSDVGGGDGGGLGNLDVQIHGLDADDVEAVWVTLRGTNGEDPRNLKLSVDAGKWSGNFRNIEVGTYTAQAWAYDEDTLGDIDDGYVGDDLVDFGAANGLVFKSVEVSVTIQRMVTAEAHFILHQETKNGGDFTPPHITGVVFSQGDVQQWETVDITVTADAGATTLTGLGRRAAIGNGWFVVEADLPANWWDSDDPQDVEDNIDGADAFKHADAFGGSPASATLTWAPEPRTTPSIQTVVLEVDDGNGNLTRIAFDIAVSGYAASFTTAFNHSPDVAVSDIFSDIDEDGSTISFTVTATDVNDDSVSHTRMSYVVASTCNGEFTSHGDAVVASGNFAALVDDESSANFVYTSTTPPEDCTFTITVTNWVLDGEDNVEDSVGAETVYTLNINDWKWEPFTF